TGYDVLGNMKSLTSYSNANGTGIVNQITHDYNGFGQVIADYENPTGQAGSTPSVRYAYDQSGNFSRLTGEVYADGGAVAYGYSADPLDGEISRIDQTSQGTSSGTGTGLIITPTTVHETDKYLGGSMVIGRTLPQTSVTETTSLDPLNRVSGLDWVQSRPGTSGADLDQYTY